MHFRWHKSQTIITFSLFLFHLLNLTTTTIMSKRTVDFRAFRIKRKRVYLPETDEEWHDENERRVDEMERELKQEKEEKQRLKELQEKKEEERRAM